MLEGWIADDYLIVFTDEESAKATASYCLDQSLPGFTIVGLRGWEDFIVRDLKGSTYTVPTVPLDGKYLEPFSVPSIEGLAVDSNLVGKIKWYVHPIVFGGSPVSPENLSWVTHDQHVDLVVWWNATYRKHK